MDFEFRPRPGITIVAALVALVFTALAIWQVFRFLEKSALEDEWNSRQSDAPAVLDSLEGFDGEASDFRRVRAIGVLDTSRIAIYDHRRFRAEPGCWIASPLSLRGGGTIVVVRGFVPHTPTVRCSEAEIDASQTDEFTALVHTPRPNLADVPHREQRGDTLFWDTFDVEGTYTSFEIEDGPSTPTVLVLGEEHVGNPFPLASFEHVSDPYLTSMRHLNYAGTWFILLLAVFGVWGATSMKRVDTQSQ